DRALFCGLCGAEPDRACRGNHALCPREVGAGPTLPSGRNISRLVERVCLQRRERPGDGAARNILGESGTQAAVPEVAHADRAGENKSNMLLVAPRCRKSRSDEVNDDDDDDTDDDWLRNQGVGESWCRCRAAATPPGETPSVPSTPVSAVRMRGSAASCQVIRSSSTVASVSSRPKRRIWLFSSNPAASRISSGRAGAVTASA